MIVELTDQEIVEIVVGLELRQQELVKFKNSPRSPGYVEALRIRLMDRLNGVKHSSPMQLYKVVKIMRVSARRTILQRGLTREEARMMVQTFPNAQRHIVVFEKQAPILEEQ